MIGETVGNFRVLSLLGAGGMGEVYLAEQVSIETRVAIKVLQAGVSKDQEQVQRFFNEAKAVGKVRHAGTVKIFDCGYHKGHAYLVMEFLDGESLAGRIRRLGTLPGDMIADIGRQIAGVLDAVHAVGITHRDLKPDNIFLVPDHELPSGERVKVLDFGIAKLTGTMAGPQTKGTMGTPAYMAPEQWNNAASVDGRADTYSLGCVMFEMAVGKPPFPSDSIGVACTHHLHTKPPRPSELQPSVPPEFDTLVDRMLSKTTDLRPSIKEVSRAFDDLRSSGATSRWAAASVSAALAATVPPALASKIPSASGSQPAAYQPPHPGQSAPFPLHHVPGMQNPLVARNDGSNPFLPQQQVQHTTPLHHTPQHMAPPHMTPPHMTPQHVAPQQYTPQHPAYSPYPPQQPTTMPRGEAMGDSSSTKKGLLIGGIAAVVLAGGATGLYFAMKGPSPANPGPTADPHLVVDGGVDKIEQPIDAAAPAEPTAREKLVATNPFKEVYGVRILSRQVTVGDYKLVMGKAPPPESGSDDMAPAAWLTLQEATKFCEQIDGRLPTSEEWQQAAKGAWGIAVGDTAGPLQEWTSTMKDDLAVVRGGHAKMTTDQLAKAAKLNPPYFIQKDADEMSLDRKAVAGATIGFRCVDSGKHAGTAIGSYGIGSRAPKVPGPSVSIGQPQSNGDLDKAIIRRYIKRNIQKIQYCYEKELLANPALQGTVQTQFFIQPSGKVANATATGVNAQVASCIAELIKTIEFPAPKNGGGVQVNYPFTFRPTGG